MLLFAGLSNKHKAADLLGGDRVREREGEREGGTFIPQGSKKYLYMHHSDFYFSGD